MAAIHNGNPEVLETTSIPLLWGVSKIAAEIGRTPRQTHHMLEQGHLPAKKVGGRWCANRADLVAFFKMEKAG